MCLCLIALSCSHCDVVNPTLQIRRIVRRSAVALSSPMCQITADVPASDIIIGLTLVFKSDNIHKKSKPNRIEIELLIEKSNRNQSKSIKLNRNITRANCYRKIHYQCKSSLIMLCQYSAFYLLIYWIQVFN